MPFWVGGISSGGGLPFDKSSESSVFERPGCVNDILKDASRSGVPEMVSLLIDKHGVGRGDPERLAEALQNAARSGKSATVSYLARRLIDKHDAVVPVEALRRAAAFGHVDVVDLLCSEFGANAHADGGGIALKSAASQGCRAVVDLLCGKYNVDASAHDNSAVRAFAYFGDAAMVDKLVRAYGARGRDERALEIAAKMGHLPVVRLLMTEHGARPSPPHRDGNDDPTAYAARVAREELPHVECYIEMPPPFGFTTFVEEACGRRDRLRHVVHVHATLQQERGLFTNVTSEVIS
jgi:hypothetical protein